MIQETTQVQTDPSIIDFGIGQPQLELLPRQLLLRASQELLSQPDCTPLNYGHPKGDGRFRVALAEFLSRGYGCVVDPNLFVTTSGASQALDLIAQRFARQGDTILVEEPTYFLAHQIFCDRGLQVIGVPLGPEGIDLEVLEKLTKKHRPAFLYTIPAYQNPTGLTLPTANRLQLIEMARRWNFLIVADEVYQLLSYDSAAPQPFAAHLESGVILSVGSFSKILSPGLRLGWIQAPQGLQKKILESGVLHSGGGLNHFVSCLVSQFISNGSQSHYLKTLHNTYAARVDVMDRCLKNCLGERVSYQKPGGGYFFWIQLLEKIDSEALLARAGAFKVGFRAGRRFSSCGGLGHYLRLSFAHYDEDSIALGVERLASALREAG